MALDPIEMYFYVNSDFEDVVGHFISKKACTGLSKLNTWSKSVKLDCALRNVDLMKPKTSAAGCPEQVDD